MVNLLQKIYSKKLSSNTSSVTSGTKPHRDIGKKEAIFFHFLSITPISITWLSTGALNFSHLEKSYPFSKFGKNIPISYGNPPGSQFPRTYQITTFQAIVRQLEFKQSFVLNF
jgi:hypothetical protein